MNEELVAATNGQSLSIEQEPVGIRGWLILPAIGLVLSLAVTPIGIVAGLVTMDGEYVAYSGPALLANAGFYIYLWVAAVRFFKKLSSAPRTLIQFMVARVVASIALFVLGIVVVGLDNELVVIRLLRANNFIAQGIAASIWIPYFRVSKRVKATFVH